MQYKKAKGEITVFLTLLFSILSAFILVIVESARNQAIRVQTERVMQTSIHSVFGEYNQDLLSYYRIFAIDPSYRGSRGSIEDVRVHLAEYAQENFVSSDLSKQESDWLKISVDKTEILRYQFLSDEGGAVLVDQALTEILEQGEIPNRSDIVHAARNMHETDDGGFMSAFSEMVQKAKNREDNPAANVLEMAQETDLLAMALRESFNGNRMEGDCPSRRHLNKGTYAGHAVHVTDGGYLFDAYLQKYFGRYTSVKDHAVFRCEQEYLIAGMMSEEDCLRECAHRILAQREGRNLDGMESNEDVLKQTEELASEICATGGDLYYTQMSLLYAWAYAESVVELSRLLYGGRVEMEGYSDPQVVPLDELEDFVSYCASTGGSGENYTDYLTGLLADTGRAEKTMRCMDLIEQNIVHIGHPGFRIDAGVTYFDAKMHVQSIYGHACEIKREYGYMIP